MVGDVERKSWMLALLATVLSLVALSVVIQRQAGHGQVSSLLLNSWQSAPSQDSGLHDSRLLQAMHNLSQQAKAADKKLESLRAEVKHAARWREGAQRFFKEMQGMMQSTWGWSANSNSSQGDEHGTGSQPRYWLTIGIPTQPRKGVTYLTSALMSILNELTSDPQDPFYGRVRVLVMNNAADGQRHLEFEALRDRARAGKPGDSFAAKVAAYVDFLDNPKTVTDPYPDLPEPDRCNNFDDKAGRQTRKQTCDVITLMRHAVPLSHYYLSSEDDFEMCPYGLRALHYVISKANGLEHLRDWQLLRVAYLFAGIIFRNSDLPAFADYLWENIAAKPPDLLLRYYASRLPHRNTTQLASQPRASGLASPPLPTADRRPEINYKYVLLRHIGKITSFTTKYCNNEPREITGPGCWEDQASSAWMADHELFSRACDHTDLSPCVPEGEETKSAEQWMQLPLDWRTAVPH